MTDAEIRAALIEWREADFADAATGGLPGPAADRFDRAERALQGMADALIAAGAAEREGAKP